MLTDGWGSPVGKPIIVTAILARQTTLKSPEILCEVYTIGCDKINECSNNHGSSLKVVACLVKKLLGQGAKQSAEVS